MVSKESSHLLTSQTNGKSTLADKLPGTMTVRSVLLNRDSPDIESRLKKRRNRTHQVRFKDLEDGSSSSGNSGTGDNSSHQKTTRDFANPHALRKHASRTPLPWADEPHISSLPGQTSVVGAVRGDMASTIEVVAAFLARAPPHPLTPGPTRRCWTPPQANSLTLPMARKPSTSTAIQTSPCLKKPLVAHTRSHSLGDSVAIDGDDEHDSQDENFIHNNRLGHRPKDFNGPSGGSERTIMERKSKSRAEIKSAVTVVKSSRQSCPSAVSHAEPCHCCSVACRESAKRQGSSTPSLVRRRKRFSRTTSDPGKEVHYCTTPTQTESHSLSPPRASAKLCTSQVQTKTSSSCSNPKYFATQTEQSLPVNDPTLLDTNMDTSQTPTKSASCDIHTAGSIEPSNTSSQIISPCASQLLTSPVNTMQIRSESLESSFVKIQDPLPNQTVPYNFTHITPYLPTHMTLHAKTSFSPEKTTTCTASTQLIQLSSCSDGSSVSMPHSVTPVVTPLSVTPNVTFQSVSPKVTHPSEDTVIPPQSLSSVFTPHCEAPLASLCSVISDVKDTVSTFVTEQNVTPVTPDPVASDVTSLSAAPDVTFPPEAPDVTCLTVVSDVTSLSVAPDVTSMSVAPALTSLSVAPAVSSLSVTPDVTSLSVAPDVTSLSVAPAVTSLSVAPAVTSLSVTPDVTSLSVAPGVTSLSVAPAVTTPSVAPLVTLHSETPVVVPNSVAPQPVDPIVTSLSIVSDVTPFSVEPLATSVSVASLAMPLSVMPVVTPNSNAPLVTLHSESPVVIPNSVPHVATPMSAAPVVTQTSIVQDATPHFDAPDVTPLYDACIFTSNAIAPNATLHSSAHVATPLYDTPIVTPNSIAPLVTLDSEDPLVFPNSVPHVATRLCDASIVASNSIAPNAPHSGAHVVTPLPVAPLVSLHMEPPVVISNSVAPLVYPHSITPIVAPHSTPVASSNSIAPHVTLHTEAPAVIPNSIPNVATLHSIAPNATPHSGTHVVTPLSVPPVCTSISIAPTPHPILNCSVVPQSSTPNTVILPVYSCSTSLSVIQDCTSPISNIYPSSSLTCSNPVPKITPVVPSNVTDITRRVPTPVNVIPLLPNATCPTNVAPCTFVTQTAISCTSISYYTTSHPIGPTGPQSHILPPAYATLVQTVSHCNIPCQVLQNAINTKITPFSSPVPKLKSCTSQPILVKTYTSNLPIVQQCVTPTKKAPLYSSTFRAAPPYTPPSKTQDKRGLRLPPPPPPPPPYTPRKNTNDTPAAQTPILRTDNNVTEKDKDSSKDKKESVKSKDSPKLSGRASSLKYRAQTPPVTFMKERGSPAKACLKSTCLSSAQAQLGVLHKMLCSGARPRPNTPCQFPLPQTQQGRSRIRRCSVPSDCPTTGPLTPAQADTLRQVQEILGGLMSGAKCKLDPSKVTEKLLSPNGPLRDIRSLQTQLQSLEGVLETSQNTIKVLLDVIQDLEKKEAVRDGRHLYRTGQDIENCGTCRDCACIIYSVEHDFRLQEGQVVRTWKVGDPPEARPQTPTPPPSTPTQQDSPQAERPPVSAKKNRKKCFWFL